MFTADQVRDELRRRYPDWSHEAIAAELDLSAGLVGMVLAGGRVNGPTWDGNVSSKNGRGELCRSGLAWHEHGYASLTPEGLRVAVEWPIADLQRRHDDRWLKKRRDS
jgi:hypothetical protein